MGRAVNQILLFDHRQAVVRGGVVPVLQLLEQATHANLKEFIEIAGGDGKELHSLQDGIVGILGLFQHAPVELQPRLFAVDKASGMIERLSDHMIAAISTSWRAWCAQARVPARGARPTPVTSASPS